MVANTVQPQSLQIMGVPVSPFESYEHAVECVDEALTARRKTWCVAINPEKVYRANRDQELLGALGRAEYGICDGVGVALGTRLLHGRATKRCTGVDLFLNLVAAAAKRSWKVFLLGARPEVNARAAENLTRRFPGLQIVGRQDGYFKDDDAVIEQINASGADLLFVAMGSPRQEYWIDQHRHRIDAPFCMGVGGTLDVASGTVKRAPAICRRTGTEFLYRLLTNPQRIRRQLVLPLFAWEVLRQAVRQRRISSSGS